MSVFKASTSYRPFRYPWAFEAYDIMQKLHWLPSEVPLQEDIHDWNKKLTPAEQNLLTQLFRFFTQADDDIGNGGYADKYIPTFKPTEIRMMLFAFAASEANHMHSYSQLIDTIGLPESEYEAFTEFEEMKEKHEYLFADRTKGMDGKPFSEIEQRALDLAVFSAFGEGMQLFSSFAVLLSFKRRNLMKGMSTIVEWSLRDESHHVESMIKLFHTMIKENPKAWTKRLKDAIRETAIEMVKLEDKFIDLMFAMGPIEGITPEEVKAYIRYTADRRMIQLGLRPIYGQKDNPLDWVDEMMSAHTHTNFFEGRATEYSKGGVTGWSENPFGFIDRIRLMLNFPKTAPAGFVDEEETREPKSETIVLYSKAGCPFCSLLKDGLTNRGFSYTEIDLTDDSLRQEFYANTGFSTVPQVFLDDGKGTVTKPSGKSLGGWSEISKSWESLGSPHR